MLSLAQNPADHDTYDTRFTDLETSLKDRQDKYYARVLWGNQQEEEYNAWRGKEWHPTRDDLGLEIGKALSQHKAIPDGYTFNFENLKDSIKNTHDAAEAARNAAVNA